MNAVFDPKHRSGIQKGVFTSFILLALAAFVALFIIIGTAYFQFVDSRFPNVGTSIWLANLWGVVSRAHLIIVIVPLVLWKPRLFGFQAGKIFQHYRMLLLLLTINCGVVAGYLLLAGSTPYSGNQWTLTEVVTVPLVEESFWRGLVLTGLMTIFQKLYSAKTSNLLAVLLSGISFGLLHMTNLIAGVDLPFVIIQSLSAVIWGVMYGFARVKTQSIYPAILLHAAMNLVVVLF